MTTETTERDLVEEVQNFIFISNNCHLFPDRARELLRRLVEENKRLRLQVDAQARAYIREVVSEDEN